MYCAFFSTKKVKTITNICHSSHVKHIDKRWNEEEDRPRARCKNYNFFFFPSFFLFISKRLLQSSLRTFICFSLLLLFWIVGNKNEKYRIIWFFFSGWAGCFRELHFSILQVSLNISSAVAEGYNETLLDPKWMSILFPTWFNDSWAWVPRSRSLYFHCQPHYISITSHIQYYIGGAALRNVV